MTLRYPDNPLDVFLADLKRRGRLAKAPVRRRRKRIAKKIARRAGFLRCPHRTDNAPESIKRIARVTVGFAPAVEAARRFGDAARQAGKAAEGFAAAFEDVSKFDEPLTTEEHDAFDAEFNR